MFIFVLCFCVTVAWILKSCFHVLIIMGHKQHWHWHHGALSKGIQDAQHHKGTSNNVCKAVPERM
jgi:hypothetical protein